MPDTLIILGASARAAAQSALRAGFRPWCIDRFADRDLREVASVRRCPEGNYPYGMLKLLDEAPDGQVLLTGALENYPDLLDAITMERGILGPDPEAIRSVRDPQALATVVATDGLRPCRTLSATGLWGRLRRVVWTRWPGRSFLVKPVQGAGGVGVEFASAKRALSRQVYLQQYVKGTPISAVFVTDGWSVKLLGATEQIIGDPSFGSREFRYAGSLGPIELTETQRAAMAHLGVVLAQRHNLRLLFGVDLVMDRKGNLHPVEVNPRYTASVELIERATGIACVSPWPVAVVDSKTGKAKVGLSTRRRRSIHGKAIIFAKQDGIAGDLYEQFEKDEIADVPDPGRKFTAGDPICTIFAVAPDRDSCLARLHEQAKRLYTHLGP